MDKSEHEFDEAATVQAATMSKNVTTDPERFQSELREMIGNSQREDGPNYASSITANGENPKLLISKEHFKLGSNFNDKSNRFTEIISQMNQEFGIAIKYKRVKPREGYWSIKEISW